MTPWVLTAVGLGFAGLYFGLAVYGEARRHKSAFWRGFTDVTGLRDFGMNRDKDDT